MKRYARRFRLLLIAALITPAALSDFFSSHDPGQQDLEHFLSPPSRIHFVDQGGNLTAPFVCAYELSDALDVRYSENCADPHPLRFLERGYPYRLFGIFPSSLHLISAPGLHLLGTDELGRDILARVLAGARTSLLTVLMGTTVYIFLGTLVGTIAAFSGRRVDALLMRTSEFVLALPALYLVLAARALLPSRLGFWQTLAIVAAVIASVAWPPLARGVRALLMQIRSAGYVDAARTMGCGPVHIFRNHMLPGLRGFVLAQSLVTAPLFLLGEVVLSYLDVGFRDTGISWGAMLKNLKDPRMYTDFWWNLAPLACVFGIMLCLNVLSAAADSREPLPARP